MANVEKSVMSNGNKRLCLNKILNSSNIEPTDELDNEILTLGNWYTVVDSHYRGALTGQIIDKDVGSYVIDLPRTGEDLPVRLNYHDLLFVMETKEI